MSQADLGKSECADFVYRIQTALGNASSGAKRLETIDALTAAVRDSSHSYGGQTEATNLYRALVRSIPETWNYELDETLADANILASLCTSSSEDVIWEILLPSQRNPRT